MRVLVREHRAERDVARAPKRQHTLELARLANRHVRARARGGRAAKKRARGTRDARRIRADARRIRVDARGTRAARGRLDGRVVSTVSVTASVLSRASPRDAPPVHDRGPVLGRRGALERDARTSHAPRARRVRPSVRLLRRPRQSVRVDKRDANRPRSGPRGSSVARRLIGGRRLRTPGRTTVGGPAERTRPRTRGARAFSRARDDLDRGNAARAEIRHRGDDAAEELRGVLVRRHRALLARVALPDDRLAAASPPRGASSSRLPRGGRSRRTMMMGSVRGAHLHAPAAVVADGPRAGLARGAHRLAPLLGSREATVHERRRARRAPLGAVRRVARRADDVAEDVPSFGSRVGPGSVEGRSKVTAGARRRRRRRRRRPRGVDERSARERSAAVGASETRREELPAERSDDFALDAAAAPAPAPRRVRVHVAPPAPRLALVRHVGRCHVGIAPDAPETPAVVRSPERDVVDVGDAVAAPRALWRDVVHVASRADAPGRLAAGNERRAGRVRGAAQVAREAARVPGAVERAERRLAAAEDAAAPRARLREGRVVARGAAQELRARLHGDERGGRGVAQVAPEARLVVRPAPARRDEVGAGQGLAARDAPRRGRRGGGRARGRAGASAAVRNIFRPLRGIETATSPPAVPRVAPERRAPRRRTRVRRRTLEPARRGEGHDRPDAPGGCVVTEAGVGGSEVSAPRT